MKRLIAFTLLIFSIFHFNSLYTQTCTIDYTYTQPGIYPDSLPDGFIGNAYSEDVTFVMILDTMGATITNFQIVNIALPVGLDWECDNSAGGCNYDPQSNIYGCINIFGSPLLAGDYDIEVSILVNVVASGQTINNIPISFSVFMAVNQNNPGSGNSGFSMNNSSGCYPASIDFTNNNPGLAAYFWDFDNGNTSTAENPSTQQYNSPGEYHVTYQAYNSIDTVDVYTLTSFTIEDVTESWTGAPWGWELLNGNMPDPYFILYEDGNLIYQSTFEYNNNGPITWTMNINLDPNKTYEISVMDADESAAQINTAEFTYGSDDYIGSHNINLNSCSNCSAGSYADVSYTIDYLQILPSPSILSNDTIQIYDVPGQPNIEFDNNLYVLSTDSTHYGLQWYVNDTIIAGNTSPTDTIETSGYYHLIAFNNYGCGTSSDTIYAVYCDSTNPSPVIDINSNLELYTSAPLGWTIQWNNNGSPIAGANSETYFPQNTGDYTVSVINLDGCTYTSNPYIYTVGIENFTQNLWSVFPNPTKNEVFINWSSNLEINELNIYDISGKNIYTLKDLNSNSSKINLRHYKSGIYIISIVTNKGYLTKTIAKTN